ncbi:glycoside hydrolase family 88 protein [Paenibacillus sp. FSL R7-0345]|uniref:glycoside hydrolase family 88/105 protein n=1 Tax=Paenibacillus sp. FSL R7-0345 TaxID=2954535 RepID=UPI00315AA68E
MFHTKLLLESQLEQVFEYMTAERHAGNWGMDISHWDWVPGVGVISILDYGLAAGEDKAVHYVQEWVERNRRQAGEIRVINSMAPYAVFPGLYRRTQDSWFLLKAEEIAGWMLKTAPRTREGALEHTVTEAADFPEQVWADTVYMAVLFLARLAGLNGERRMAEAALEQTLLHLRLLQDGQTGLLFHGWNCREGCHMSAVRWARANAWITLAVPQIAAEIKGITGIPDELHIRYNQLAAALRACQAEDGLWHTVLNRPDYYKETSGSAGIACGFIRGVSSGLLDASYLASAEQALAGILPLITNDGEVQGVSGGTPVMPSVEDYGGIAVYPTLYGQGLVMQLLAQTLALPGMATGDTPPKERQGDKLE